MKNRILVITAMLAVMVGMMGIAAAGSNVATPNTVNLPDNGIATADINYSGYNSGITINWYLYNSDGVTLATEIEAKDNGIYSNSSSYTTLFDGQVQTITIHDLPSLNTQPFYRLKTCKADDCTFQSVTVQIIPTSIPEFPTVALPVAAVIGLVFFFQNKKKKE